MSVRHVFKKESSEHVVKVTITPKTEKQEPLTVKDIFDSAFHAIRRVR